MRAAAARTTDPVNLLILCRPGFEPEAAAEIAHWAAQRELAGYPEATRGEGWARFHAFAPQPSASAPGPWDLIFARQCVEVIADLPNLDREDRLAPMLEALEHAAVPPLGEVIVEHPDSDAARPLSGLARSFGNALRPALRRAGLLAATADLSLPCLHVCFLSGTHAVLGLSHPRGARLWPQGIARLRVPSDAPSRSAAKLEEALETLMSASERARWLQPGMRAADLGAAPGGWSFILARRHVQVTAIDNGPLQPALLDTGLVEHLRADGFTWQPSRPLDWMVCDMVEQPRRVAARMADWFIHGWCRHAIFNLKLPMKKRWAEVQANLADFHDRCDAAGVRVQSRARQLYHDREEITVLAWTER